MKVAILAGGLGTRLSEETGVRPKPMVEVGGMPILWHIMKIYSHYGINDFVVLCGYKGNIIKKFFIDYYTNHSDLTVDLEKNTVDIHRNSVDPWKVTLLDTGRDAMTGARLKKAEKYLSDETFMLTYGDGVSDVNIADLLQSHRNSGCSATLTAVQPSGRFGALEIDTNNHIKKFREKPKGDGSWINGGFFVLEPEIFTYLPEGDKVVWEQDPLMNLAADGKLNAFHHNGFWKPMDTLKDKMDLQAMWDKNEAPWKIWDRPTSASIKNDGDTSTNPLRKYA